MSSSKRSRMGLLLSLGVHIAAEVAVGKVLTHCGETKCEAKAAQYLRSHHDPRMDELATAVGWFTDVPRAIAAGIISVVGVRGATRRSDLALLPVGALATASATHVATSLLVKRPRPEAERLGTQQITSAYPSGHVGAITANSIVLGALAGDAPGWFRAPFRAICVAAPILVGWARLRTAQHHLGDVVAGYANGIAAATTVLAWRGPTHDRAQGQVPADR